MKKTNLLKICGINDPAIARCAVKCGADFLGFIFWHRSPRYVTVERAEEILAEIPDRKNCRFAGVFLDSGEEEIRAAGRRLKLDVIQLHGDFPAAAAESLRREFEVWKAVSSESGWDSGYPADGFLVDSRTPGSGMRSDWRLAETIRDSGRKVILAGGLSIGNLRQAAALNCYALDVNSSLEDEPGRKSLPKTEQLFEEYNRRCGNEQ